MKSLTKDFSAPAELHDLLPSMQVPSIELLRDMHTFAERCDVLVRWLHDHLGRTEVSTVRRTVAALSLIDRGIVRVSELADRVGCTRRSLERAFRSSTGLAPAGYLRLRRIDQRLPRLRATGARLDAIAADAGFADQAHFSCEFRRIAGISPSEYRLEQGVSEPLLP